MTLPAKVCVHSCKVSKVSPLNRQLVNYPQRARRAHKIISDPEGYETKDLRAVSEGRTS